MTIIQQRLDVSFLRPLNTFAGSCQDRELQRGLERDKRRRGERLLAGGQTNGERTF